MSDGKTIVEFIPVEKLEKNPETEDTERVYQDTDPYTETAEQLRPLNQYANSGNGVSRVSVPRDLSRKRITQAFTDAFELIGGVPRLAHWGDQNPGDFFKLFARMIPNVAQQQIEHSGDIRVIHALQRSELDE